MQSIYKHTQPGKVMLVLLIFPIVGFVLALTLAARPAPLPPLLILLAFLLITVSMFHSLTVKVDEQEVLLYFGLGFPRRSFPLEQLRRVRVVRNSPLMGLGIHFIHGGMIYNVSGLDGVEITLENGHLVRIGTDEPAALVQAIEEAMRLPSSLLKF